MKITIVNLQKKIPVNPIRIKSRVLKVLSSECIKKSGEITVSFVNDAKIKKLNLDFLGKSHPTDVLAFDSSDKKDKKHIFADIVISTETAIRNARIYKTSPSFELNLYLVHGLLHLIGYDDHTLKQTKIMRQMELEYVNT